MSDNQKAYIELNLPESCIECNIAFMHEVESSGKPYCYGCGFLNVDVTDNTDSRRPDCPLKTPDHCGYEDHFRIGNKSDALRLLEEMVYKCKSIKPRPDYNDFEKKLFEVGTLNHVYFLPRIESILDALSRDII